MSKVVNIMGIPFDNLTKQDLIDKLSDPEMTKGFIVTANPEIVMATRNNDDYKKSVLSADYVIADGIGVIIASKWLKQPLQERIPGFELMMSMIDYASSARKSCYFLGASEEVNLKAVEQLKIQYPQLIVAGHHHGFFDLKDEAIVKQVREANPDFIFVALGMPRQEQWIAKNIESFSKGVFMGVGGSFDVAAGEVKRAPDIWIKLNLEWLYRLIKQPFRWKRILKVFDFIFRIIFRKY